MLSVAGSLGWPIFWGLALSGVFFALLLQGPLNTPLMMRYFAGHYINVCTTLLFFVGVASLTSKFFSLPKQYDALGKIHFPDPARGGDSLGTVGTLLDQLATLPKSVRSSLFSKRLFGLLDDVERSGSTRQLADEMKYASESDVGQQQDSYALVRIVIWAAPMLGFLGTVVGITDALGSLDVKQLATDSESALGRLMAGLYVAFDTTAQALLLSMILMFAQFLCDRIETHLLSCIDRLVNDMLSGRFQELGNASDPHLASVERMMGSVVNGTQALVQKQTDLWRVSMTESQGQVGSIVEKLSERLHGAVAQTLASSLERHSQALEKTETQATEQLRARWEQWQTALSDNARILHKQQVEMTRQSEQLTQALKATADVIKLEEALNANLSTLAGAKHFEETVMSLSAAIHLLNVRLGKADAQQLEIQPKPKGRAA